MATTYHCPKCREPRRVGMTYCDFCGSAYEGAQAGEMDQGSAARPLGQPPAAPSGGTRAGFTDFLNFRLMITPPLITVLWVVSVIVITIGAVVTPTTNVLAVIVAWGLGMLWVRVVFEVMIVLFRINDGIQTIARRR